MTAAEILFALAGLLALVRAWRLLMDSIDAIAQEDEPMQ